VEVFDSHGNLKSTHVAGNIITNKGVAYIINRSLISAANQFAADSDATGAGAWYVNLFDFGQATAVSGDDAYSNSFTGTAGTDRHVVSATLLSGGGNTNGQAYSLGAVINSTVAGANPARTISNSGSPASFTIRTSGSVSGVYLTNVQSNAQATINADQDRLLFSIAEFNSGAITGLQPNDTVNVTYTHTFN
jgi:hypothetical protein